MNYKTALTALAVAAILPWVSQANLVAHAENTSSGPDLGGYKKDIEARIKQAWSAPHVNEEFCTCIFDLLPDGHMANLRTTHSSGLDYFDKSALSAITKSDPYPSLPGGAAGAHVTATLEVNGNVTNVNLEVKASSVVAPPVSQYAPPPATSATAGTGQIAAVFHASNVDNLQKPVPSAADASNVVLTDPYLINVQHKVEKHWHPDIAGSGSTICAFVINKMGDVLHVRLIKSSGNPALDQAAVKAIDGCLPFKPVPSRLDTMSVKIVFEKTETSKRLITSNE